MPNPIFQQMPNQAANNPAVNPTAFIRSMLAGDQKQAYMDLRAANPAFREFSDKMQGKTVTQAYGEYGQDPNAAWNMFFGRR